MTEEKQLPIHLKKSKLNVIPLSFLPPPKKVEKKKKFAVEGIDSIATESGLGVRRDDFIIEKFLQKQKYKDALSDLDEVFKTDV